MKKGKRKGDLPNWAQYTLAHQTLRLRASPSAPSADTPNPHVSCSAHALGCVDQRALSVGRFLSHSRRTTCPLVISSSAAPRFSAVPVCAAKTQQNLRIPVFRCGRSSRTDLPCL